MPSRACPVKRWPTGALAEAGLWEFQGVRDSGSCVPRFRGPKVPILLGSLGVSHFETLLFPLKNGNC